MASTRLKMAVLTPMPKANVTIPTQAKAGAFLNNTIARRRSWTTADILPTPLFFKNITTMNITTGLGAVSQQLGRVGRVLSERNALVSCQQNVSIKVFSNFVRLINLTE